jgi:hypothetical protein
MSKQMKYDLRTTRNGYRKKSHSAQFKVESLVVINLY